MKLNKKNLIILLLIMILANYLIPVISKAYSMGEDIVLKGYGTVPYHLRNAKYNGNYVSTHLVGYYDNGTFYPAYCMNVDRAGADNSNSHTVNLMNLLTDSNLYNKVWRVVTSGYPYHSAKELGVSDWRYAYRATKTSVYCVLGQANVEDYYRNRYRRKRDCKFNKKTC